MTEALQLADQPLRVHLAGSAPVEVILAELLIGHRALQHVVADHQDRGSRRILQKSDPSDAERAARAVLAGEASGEPKSGEGRVEMIRALRAVRRSAIKARTQAANRLQSLRVTAPEGLRHRLRGLPTNELASVAARFRLADGPRDVPSATRFALRSVARRYETLSKEIVELEAHLERLVAQSAPELVALPGIGTENAATLLIVALETTPKG